MTNKEIFEFIDRFERSTLNILKVTSGDFSLELGRTVDSSSTASQTVPVVKTVPVSDLDASPSITAPVVGVFYAAPDPNAKPFVAKGDAVKKGQTVCLMEAMKMLSEVTAPCDCIITEVLKENGTLAGFGEPLFRYDPC